MDLKDPKTQKLALVVIVFLILAYAWYNKLYMATNVEIMEKYAQYAVLQNQLIQVEQKAKSLEKLKAEYNEFLQSYKPIQQLLPEKLEFSTFLNQIHAAAQSSRSIVFDISPGGSEAHEYYDATNYKVSIATTYHEMGKFFAQISNFPFIVNLSKLKMEKYKELPKKPKLVDKTIIADFTLTTYNSKTQNVGQAQ
jgi:Tfp pilus assembly protein PilO